MSIALTCSWRPRGEVPRLQRLRSRLEEVYDHIVIVVPPNTDTSAGEPLRSWSTTTLISTPDWPSVRHVAIRQALELPVSHVHLADLDSLVRWIEARPDEWGESVAMMQTVDCLITGRSERALGTRPRAIRETERIINEVGSYLLGQPIDLGVGSRGFSRRAARLVLENSRPSGYHDMEWPVLVHRAGLSVTYIAADGVDWEGPDHYREMAADPGASVVAAARYDQNPEGWGQRVRTAQIIIREGLAAAQRPLSPVPSQSGG